MQSSLHSSTLDDMISKELAKEIRKAIDEEVVREMMKTIPRVNVIKSFPYQRGTRHIVNIDKEILDWLTQSNYNVEDWHITGGTDKRVSVDEKVLNAMVLKYG